MSAGSAASGGRSGAGAVPTIDEPGERHDAGKAPLDNGPGPRGDAAAENKADATAPDASLSADATIDEPPASFDASPPIDSAASKDVVAADAPPAAAKTCEVRGKLPLTPRTVLVIPSVDDFAFDGLGNAVAVDFHTHDLIAQPLVGPRKVLVPNLTSGTASFAVRVLPDGHILVSANSAGAAGMGGDYSVYDVDPAAGTTTTLGTVHNFIKYLAVDSSGFAYAAGEGAIFRIDTGTPTNPVSLTDTVRSKLFLFGITISPDYSTLYVNEDSGQISKIALGPDRNVVGPLQPLAKLNSYPGNMTTDECGNIYAAGGDGNVWRVTPAGQSTIVATSQIAKSRDDRLNSINFGSGVGGWKATALYLGHPSGTLEEVDLGVRGM